MIQIEHHKHMIVQKVYVKILIFLVNLVCYIIIHIGKVTVVSNISPNTCKYKHCIKKKKEVPKYFLKLSRFIYFFNKNQPNKQQNIK